MTRIVPAVLAGCLLFAACGGSDDSSSTTTSTTDAADATEVSPVASEVPAVTDAPDTTTTAPLVVEGATVVVANGNIVGGSAGRMTDALAAEGFTTGAAVNGTEKIEDSVVYYSAAEGAQTVAESLAVKLGGVTVEPLPETIPTEDGTLEGADVLLLLGNNQADKSIAELSGGSSAGTDVEAVDNAGSTVVVANGNTIGGSAGAMSGQLEAAGFTVGDPVNSTAQATESVVYYVNTDAQADAEALAAALGGLTVLEIPSDIPTESGSLDGDILLVLGQNEAGKSLAELAG
jgi:hypothetical protein